MWYVQRTNGVVTGRARAPQPGLMEEALADDHPDIIAYENPPPPSQNDLEADAAAALNGGSAPRIDMAKLLKAKMVSDLAFRLGKPPATLTGAELTAERNRIAAIYKAL